MIKLVLSDMDNTLIWYGGDGATKRTVDAIHACQAEGVVFGPATGRNPLEVAGFLRHDEASYATGIMVNGQQIYLEGRLLQETTIDRTVLLRLLETLHGRRGVALVTYDPDGTADWIGNDRAELGSILAEAAQRGDRACRELPDYPIIKCGIIANLDHAEELALQSELRAAFPEFDFHNTTRTWFDVVPHGLSKADGIGVLARALGIGRDEICVFGDAENDLAMFAQVTHSCAVANASPEVAAAARWHIGAADEEGVAIALEQIAEAARESHRQGVEVLPAFMKEGESPHDR